VRWRPEVTQKTSGRESVGRNGVAAGSGRPKFSGAKGCKMLITEQAASVLARRRTTLSGGDWQREWQPWLQNLPVAELPLFHQATFAQP
jgi:hypothetical protein